MNHINYRALFGGGYDLSYGNMGKINIHYSISNIMLEMFVYRYKCLCTVKYELLYMNNY